MWRWIRDRYSLCMNCAVEYRHGFSDKEKIVTDSRGEEFFVAASMQDVTELNAYIREMKSNG